MSNTEKLRAHLLAFHTIASRTWTVYQNVGPGRVDAAMWEGGEDVAVWIGELLDDGDVSNEISSVVNVDDLRAAVEKVFDLAGRCATRSEGLCFITGEAGLVPRRDWHAAMDDGLTVVADAVEALRGT